MDDLYIELKELDEKIKLTSRTRDVTPHTGDRREAFEARTDELKVLIRQKIGILQTEEKELFEWIDRIKEETGKLLS
jgi:hypothetical protein